MRSIWTFVLGASLACAACARYPLPQPTLVFPLGTAHLVVRTAPAPAYRVAYLTGQWNSVQATLLQGGKVVATTTAAPVIDAQTRAREATLTFAGLAPGAGYALTLEFSLVRPNTAPVQEGMLSAGGIALSSGANTLQMDAEPKLTPAYSPGAPLGGYVESMAPVGPPAVLSYVEDVVPGQKGEDFYIDDGTVHRMYRDAAGVLTTATIAGAPGQANWGDIDGLGTSARFRDPHDLVQAPDGSLYVSDFGNCKIRRITFDAQAAATTSTVIGTGVGGFLDGPQGTAELYEPAQIALDPSGNLMVADAGNNAVRLLTLTGPGAPVLTTLAGGTAGYADGPASGARFDAPQGIAVDSGGRIFVGDTSNRRIRMLTPSAGGYTVSTIAGTGQSGSLDGPGATATFRSPTNLEVDPAGNLLILDGSRVRKLVFNPGGTTTVSTLAGAGSVMDQDCAASASEFDQPLSIALDTDGSILVADAWVIKRITAPGTPGSMVQRFVGTYDQGFQIPPVEDGHLNQLGYAPSCLARVASGTLYAAEGDTDQLAAYPGGDPKATVQQMAPIVPDAPNDGDELPALYEPSALATRDGLTFYYTQWDLHEVERVTRPTLAATGTTVTIVAGAKGQWGSTDGQGSSARFNALEALTFGPDGALYCGDQYAVRKITFDASGTATVSTIAGQKFASFNDADGPAAAAEFDKIVGLVFDSKGNLLVADSLGVRKLTFNLDGSPGTVSTIARAATDFDDDAITPQAIAVDAHDNIFVAAPSEIYQVYRDPFGQVFSDVYAGAGVGFADGPIASARFNDIVGLDYDPRGYMYVADVGNRLVRRIVLP